MTLSHHAAVIAGFLGDRQLVKHYYRQSLTQAIAKSDDEVAKQGLIELLRKHWPDVA